MPVQTQMSSFAARLGGRVAQANAEHRDAPLDTGNRRLPPGIRAGVAKLSAMYTKQQTEDSQGKTPKGETFFRASAVVMLPEQYNGEKVAGMLTQVVIPLCDVAAKGQRKAQSFSDNWYEFQNLFKLMGIVPPNETQQTDPTGQRTEAYYFAAMKTLCDPKRPPVYVEFSTRGWTPPKSPTQPNPEEIVFETWHGLSQWNGQFNPAVGVTEAPTPPAPFNEFESPPQMQTATQRGTAPPPTSGLPPQYQPEDDYDPADEVAALVMTATKDPEGATEDGAAASSRLEELAWAAGWTKEQTASPPAPFTNDWEGVGDMALTPPTVAPTVVQATAMAEMPATTVRIGGRYRFAKRTKNGARLKNNKGEEFLPQDVEIVTVDSSAKTCTVKTIKDGKDVVDIRLKQPVAVKFEWLE